MHCVCVCACVYACVCAYARGSHFHSICVITDKMLDPF